MSPPNPENDPVHKGLHQLGQQIEEASPINSAPSASPDDVADNPVEKGLHELGRQIEEAGRADRDKPGRRRQEENEGDAARRGPAHAAPKKKRSGKRTAAWVGGTLLLVIVLIAGAAAGYGWYLNHEIHRIDLKNLTSAPVKGADAGTENILMIGSTDRCALKVQNPAYGLCSQGVNGVNSDVVMILHLNPANGTLSILSIPRDLFVPNARSDGANKIDAALFQGPDQLINAIEEDFGIPIQHFVELNFDSFINVVNALGGIKMYFPEPVFDAYSGLNIQTTGCIALNGTQALQVVRARHLQYKGPGVTTTDPNYWPQENQSDLARIRRDHEFLPRARRRREGQGPQQPDHRSATRRRCRRAAHRRLGPLGHRHDQPGARVPQRQRELGAAADRACRRGPIRKLRLRRGQLRGHRVPGPASGPQRRRPIPRADVERRRHLRRRCAPIPLDGHGLGHERVGRLQPGDQHGDQPAGARVPHRDDRRQHAGRPGGRDRRLLLVEDPGRAGRGPDRGQRHLGSE